MNGDTLIRQLAEADDYAPEHDLPETARASTVALAEIRRRIDMDAKELTKPVTPDRPPRRPWLVAVAAAATVIVLVGALTLLIGPSDDITPATAPSTTLPASPSTTMDGAEGLSAERASAFATEYQRVLDQGSRDEFIALFAPGAGRLWTIENPSLTSVDRLADEMVALRARNTSTVLSNCRPLATSVRCEMTFSGPVERALVGGDITMPMNFELDDAGLIIEVRTDFGFITSPAGMAAGRFLNWMELEHPDVYAQMVPKGQVALYADRDAEIWREWAPIWAEAGRP